ncbi:MAG: Crp/Fnr family transcriptional regulator [Oligoflexia bacterium]|nr:Crp/Fnr family transcriptional regulator [Oligoflexia bacterium]MBF0364508.1 Crp/Fnr family transcriptional regulator [Oligoflexia bacterium]
MENYENIVSLRSPHRENIPGSSSNSNSSNATSAPTLSNKGKLVRPENCANCPALDSSIFCDPTLQKMLNVGDHRVVNVYKKGQTLFVQGNPPYGLYCISSGKIKISNVGPDGKESIVRIAIAGDILGHRSLFTGQHYMGTATALEDSVVCFIDKKFMESLIQQEPKIAFNIIMKMGRDLGRAEKMVASFSQKNVPERLAELLLNLRLAYGVPDQGRWRLDIKLTREEMASMIGTASETLIRFLSEFKDQGLIEQIGKTIYLVNLKGLMDLGHLTDDHLWY